VQNSGFALYGDNPYAGEARKQGSAPFVGLMSVIPGKEELYWQWDGRPFTAIIDGEIVFELAGMRVDAPSPQTFYQAGNQLTASWTRFSSKGMYGVQIFGPLITRASQLPDISSFQAGCGDAGIAVHVHRIGKRIKNPDGTTTDVWLSQTSGTGKGRYEVTFAGPTNLSSIPSGSAFTAPHGLHGTYLNRIGTTNSAALMLDGGGPPVAGDVLTAAGVPVANTKLYLKFDAAGAVSDLSSADPGWVAMSGASPYHLTFPATLPSGHAPDVDLPAGTTITAELQAANARGTVVATSNTVTPA
jgi:hypothetical protein